MRWAILDADGFIAGVQTNNVQPANSAPLPDSFDLRLSRFVNGAWTTIDEQARRELKRAAIRTKVRSAFTQAQTDIIMQILKRVEEREED